MKIGDLVLVVAESKSYNIPWEVITRGILLVDEAEKYFWEEEEREVNHPYEVLQSDGTIFRDWANVWHLEPWED